MKTHIKILIYISFFLVSSVAYTQAKLIVSWQSTSTEYYEVSGKKLSDVYKSLENKIGTGTCEGFLNYGRDYSYKYTDNVITELTINPKCIITLPKWNNYSSADQDCKNHFDNVVEALKKHEEGHCSLVKKVIKELENFLKNNQVKKDNVSNIFGNYVNMLENEYDNYDSQTDHGRKGVSFDNLPSGCR